MERYLFPAVQCYRHERGTPGHVESRIYCYMCPTTRTSAANVRESFDGLVRAADERSVEHRLGQLPVRDYLKQLPSRAARVCERW